MTTVEKIEEILKDKGMSKRELSIRSGIPTSTIQSAFKRNKRLSLDMTWKIASALNCSATEFLQGSDKEDYIEIFGDAEKELIDLFTSTQLTKEDLNKHLLLDAFSQLNEAGQEKAVERVQELTEIPKYKREELNQ